MTTAMLTEAHLPPSYYYTTHPSGAVLTTTTKRLNLNIGGLSDEEAAAAL